MDFWKSVFSEDGQGSSSRILTVFTTAAAIACLLHVVLHNHVIPDAVTMGGLGVFAVAPYGVNQARGAIASFSK